MELFTVNRYNEEAEKNRNGKNEDVILKKLLQKAEKRKKQQKEKVKNDNDAEIANKLQKLNETEAETESAATTQDVDPTADPNYENIAEHEAVGTDEIEGFEVLGDDSRAPKPQKVDMVLPNWLAYPTLISANLPKLENLASEDNTKIDIKNLKYLTKETCQALKSMSITHLFPVQSTVIPYVLQAQRNPYPFRPRDICVSAPTGSGKTLAFAIPVVQSLANRVECKIRALVVLPVAELALQVYKVFKALCDKTEVLTVCLLSKQTPFAVEQEKLIDFYKGKYYSKVDIVITTPGRLVEHLYSTKGFCLKALKFIVIDEADRIMDAVFQNWLYHVDSHVRDTSNQLLAGSATPLCYYGLEMSYGTPHKLLFSATLSQDPEKLHNLNLFHPKLFTTVPINVEALLKAQAAGKDNDDEENAQTVERGKFIGKYTTPAELSEKYCVTESRLKPLTLFALIKENKWNKFLCFTNSNEAASRLTIVLQKLFTESLQISEISANLTPALRNQTLHQFLRGNINGIVCSDALARGMDLPNVDIVISYDLPRHIKTYIHRVGRTARAGRSGLAITLVTQNELQAFNKMLNDVGKVVYDEINTSTNMEEEYAKDYKKALEYLRQKLELKKQKKLVDKRRNTRKAVVHKKKPEEMTLMEKLQLDAEQQAKTLLNKESKPEPIKIKMKPINSNKKLNPKFNKKITVEQ